MNLDYHVLGAADGGAALEVLLVAAKRALVESYVALLDAAGLVPVVVDLDYFALPAGSLGSTAHALVHVGARSTTLHIPTAGPPGLTTDLPAGGEGFTASLAESLRVSPGTRPRPSSAATRRPSWRDCWTPCARASPWR